MERQAYWSWFEGEFSTSPQISTRSGAVQHGYGLFETVYYDGHLHYLSQHLDRLEQSAVHSNLTYLNDHELVQTAIEELVTRNDLSEGRIRLGLLATDIDYLAPTIPSQLLIEALPYQRLEQAVRLLTLDARDFDCPLSSIKSSSYMGYQRARRHAIQQGFADALLLDPNGHLVECSSSNLFLYRDGEWHTPDLSLYGLPGIQSQMIRLMMEHLGQPVRSGELDHYDWEFGFICNSLTGMQMIESINAVELGEAPEAYLILKEAMQAGPKR